MDEKIVYQRKKENRSSTDRAENHFEDNQF